MRCHRSLHAVSTPQPAGFGDVSGVLDASLDGAASVRGEYVLAEALREGLIAADSTLILQARLMGQATVKRDVASSSYKHERK